jgi:thymidylate synthase ThyX
MTIITAKVIEDSIANSNGVRLTTLQLQYPRFIHAEFMTHRVFSRNASSSRAIPVAKVIEQVRTNPAMPIHWGKNQPGMQAKEEMTGQQLETMMRAWQQAAREAAATAEFMDKHGLHKQVANRILEPFQYMHVIVTATEWENFFELRDHPDAQPEIHALAKVMKTAFADSRPVSLLDDQWHLPYVTRQERLQYFSDVDTLLKISAARCARVSYLTHDGQTPSVEKDIALYDRLVGSVPLHASPIEHQATPMIASDSAGYWSGNFRGWTQYRKLVESAVMNP